MKLTKDILNKILASVSTTKPEELGCDDCFEQLDRFAELKLAGKDAAEAMPLVEDHLNRCGACRDEFEAFLDAAQASTATTMQDLVHRCLRCETISYEVKPRHYHCPDCGFEWEVL